MRIPHKEDAQHEALTLGVFSSVLISFAMVLVSAILLRMGVQSTVVPLPVTHLDKVSQEEGHAYDLSNFKFELANLARVFFGVETVYAAGYEAEITEEPPVLTLKPGANGSITVRFKNKGHLRWRTPQTGTRYVSVYTYDPKYHLSRLESKMWRRRDQPAVLDAQAEPGEIGDITIPVTAPLESGVYRETFHLAAEDTAWITGGEFKIEVRVLDKPVTVELPVVDVQETVQTQVEDPTHTERDAVSDVQAQQEAKAILLVRSHRRVIEVGGKAVPMRFGFKNIGKDSWYTRGLSTQEVAMVLQRDSPGFAHRSWLNGTEPVRIAAGMVEPGQTAFFDFTVRTPSVAGDYIFTLHLIADGRPVDGGTVTVPVQVTASDAQPLTPQVFEGEELLMEEPRIRVGLYKMDTPIEFVSPVAYTLKDEFSAVRHSLPADTPAVLFYKDGQYRFYAAGVSVLSDSFLRLEPVLSDDAFFELTNHEERPVWNKQLNYNSFRDIFELRYSTQNDTVWVINELPLEAYVAGLAEVSNGTPEEFRKAMAVAERTYAYYQLKDGSKHEDRNFDVSASWGDQVYRGYAREKYFGEVAEGVRLTRGEVMTYNKDVVVTPYFARSDGTTRSWRQVWGGADKPWLQSVRAEYDAGKTLYGHGVGMSQRDATHRALKEKMSYQDILKYYYRGVSIERFFR